MGGPGSGSHYHWWRDGKKDVVESCRHLDAGRWMREGLLKADSWQAGTWTWFRDAEQASSLDYEVDTRGELPWLRLAYALTATGERVDYRIRLTTTRPHFGGLRWWFVCPLTVNGGACGRRVGKLYLKGRYFGCRRCQNLTYTSCQERDRRVDRLLKDPGAVDALLAGNPGLPELGLALKALSKVRRQLASSRRRRHDRRG
jgi:hypothetical protein